MVVVWAGVVWRGVVVWVGGGVVWSWCSVGGVLAREGVVCVERVMGVCVCVSVALNHAHTHTHARGWA